MVYSTLNILIADNHEGDRKQVRRALRQASLAYECIETASIEQALEACDRRAFDCAIVDYRMPGHDGLHGIAVLHERFPAMAIIMATGQGDEMVATEAMKCGASDYIAKGHIDADSISRSIENAVEKAALRRKVAQQRVELEKAAQHRDELERFASVLVHDLNAPITSIQAFASFIEETLRAEPIDKDKILSYCGRLVGAGRRMGALIDALYEFTAADAQVTFEPVDIRQVMEEMLPSLESVIRRRGARVTHGELPVVIGNAHQLMLLLQNLIGNGLKYCSAAAPTVHVAAGADGENGWLFAVTDNGIGIPQDSYRLVFEPFKRLHGVGEYEGTGLGLATCKRIVECHGGVIRCESTAGGGTTFFFTLPGAQSHA